MKHDHKWIAGAAKVLAGGADGSTSSDTQPPLHDIQQARRSTRPNAATPAEPLSSGPKSCRKPRPPRPEEPELAVQDWFETHSSYDSQPHSSGGQTAFANQNDGTPTGTEIRVGQGDGDDHSLDADTDPTCRRHSSRNGGGDRTCYRARQRLELQAQAVCRRICDGDETSRRALG